MNGPTLVRALLLARPALLAAIGANAIAKIVVGIIPAGTPSIGITEVVATEHKSLAGNATARIKSMTQITVAAATTKQTKDILAQVRYACRNFVGTINGVTHVSCLLEGTGPDFEHEAGFAMQTQDVSVSFNDAPN